MTGSQITPQRAFRLAVEQFPSQSAFAKFVGRSRAWATQLLSDANSVLPAEMVLSVERKTGLARWLLRPDIYPPEEFRNVEG